MEEAIIPKGLAKHRLRRVLDYIEANLTRKIRLSDLAEIASLSLHHFSRLFQGSMSMPPMRYVWCRRIERAKTLMGNKATSLSIIAYECGFSSQSHFTTLFKQFEEVTPSAYRALMMLQ